MSPSNSFRYFYFHRGIYFIKLSSPIIWESAVIVEGVRPTKEAEERSREGWRSGSLVKSACSSSRGHTLAFQNPHLEDHSCLSPKLQLIWYPLQPVPHVHIPINRHTGTWTHVHIPINTIKNKITKEERGKERIRQIQRLTEYILLDKCGLWSTTNYLVFLNNY